MKFSVLLPTHNRLDLLRYAVESVLRQEYDDWELIISDNVSEDDVAGYVASLDDSRVKYYRSDTFLAVTDNWNRALDKARGDYLIMLGDDDALMPGFFDTVANLAEKYQRPDLIYADAYIFGYPGVLPDYPGGYLRTHSNSFFETKEPFLLDRETAVDIVRQSLAFSLAVLFNMQYSVFSKALVDRLADRGPFFQSLFPDYYATVAAFLVAESILIFQQPLVIIGIAPQSHGFFYFNKKMEEAKSLLHDTFLERELDGLRSIFLPGDWILTGWLSAMHVLSANYAPELARHGLSVVTENYRRRVIAQVCKDYYRDKAISASDFREFRQRLHCREWLRDGIRLSLYYRISGLFGPRARASLIGAVRRLVGRRRSPDNGKQWAVDGFHTILDVFERMPAPTYQAPPEESLS